VDHRGEARASCRLGFSAAGCSFAGARRPRHGCVDDIPATSPEITPFALQNRDVGLLALLTPALAGAPIFAVLLGVADDA
jgi:hypothetical protein